MATGRAAKPLQGPEVELGAGCAGVRPPTAGSETMKRWPEPGTEAPRVRTARTSTMTLSVSGARRPRVRIAESAVPSAPVRSGVRHHARRCSSDGRRGRRRGSGEVMA